MKRIRLLPVSEKVAVSVVFVAAMFMSILDTSYTLST